MPYQYEREALTQDEATRLANACDNAREKLCVWTLLDTGLRVSELATLKAKQLDWQTHRLMIYGKGGPYGSKTKRRIIPLSPRVRTILEAHLSLRHVRDVGAAHRARSEACGRPGAHPPADIAARAAPHVQCDRHPERHQLAVAAAALRPRPAHDAANLFGLISKASG